MCGSCFPRLWWDAKQNVGALNWINILKHFAPNPMGQTTHRIFGTPWEESNSHICNVVRMLLVLFDYPGHAVIDMLYVLRVKCDILCNHIVLNERYQQCQFGVVDSWAFTLANICAPHFHFFADRCLTSMNAQTKRARCFSHLPLFSLAQSKPTCRVCVHCATLSYRSPSQPSILSIHLQFYYMMWSPVTQAHTMRRSSLAQIEPLFNVHHIHARLMAKKYTHKLMTLYYENEKINTLRIQYIMRCSGREKYEKNVGITNRNAWAAVPNLSLLSILATRCDHELC